MSKYEEYNNLLHNEDEEIIAILGKDYLSSITSQKIYSIKLRWWRNIL